MMIKRRGGIKKGCGHVGSDGSDGDQWGSRVVLTSMKMKTKTKTKE